MKPRLIVEQKITAFTNKYTVYDVTAEGKKGNLVAFAQQKRIALREKVTFYGDEAKTQVVFTFRAEKVMDVHGRYFIEDASGKLIGSFKKDFAKSLLNSTWLMLGADDQPKITIAESNLALALLRRFSGLIPIIGEFVNILVTFLRYHFVFTDATTKEPVGRYQKTTLIRDHYLLSMDDAAYKQQDWRVYAAMAVALDALQSR
jgi:uncharacterized protein YxjI